MTIRLSMKGWLRRVNRCRSSVLHKDDGETKAEFAKGRVKKPLRKAVVALAAAIALLLPAVGSSRVMVGAGMLTIREMIAAGRVVGAVRTLRSSYHFDGPEGLAALREFSMLLLRQGLSDNDLLERCYAATALAGYGDWTGRSTIVEALGSSDIIVEKAAVEGLAQAGTPEAIAILSRFYYLGGSYERTATVVASLAEAKVLAAMPILLEAAKDPNSSLAFLGVRGLGRLGDRSTLPYLHELLAKTSDPGVRIEAAHSMILLGDRSADLVQIIERALHTRDFPEASAAALALADAQDTKVSTLLKNSASDGQLDQRVRLAAAVALTHYGHADGIPLLRQALEHPTDNQYLALMLAHLDLSIGRPLLVAAMSSNDEVLRIAAIDALGRNGGEAEVPVLREVIPKTDQPIELAQIAWSLGRIGSQHCIPVLLEMVQNPAAVVRNTAAEALARTADRLINALTEQ